MKFDKEIFSLAVTMSAPIVAKFSNQNEETKKFEIPIFRILLDSYKQIQDAQDLISQGKFPQD